MKLTCAFHVLLNLCLMCTVLLAPSRSQELNIALTSTESTVTLEWDVEDNATFYQVTWHRSFGFYFYDQQYYPPFDTAVDGRLNYSLQGLIPGDSYTFLLFRNGNSTDYKVFGSDIRTVPLPPENLAVLNRTSASVLLNWEPGYNSSQDHYEVEYQLDGAIQTVVANSSDDPLTFNLMGLMPGHTYLLSMRAVSGDKRSNGSVPVTAITAPGRPENLTVSAVSTDTLTASWEAGNNSLQDSFEVQYRLVGEETQTIVSGCTASPCQFSVSGEPGQLYEISVYALQQSFRSEAATVRHNTAPAAPSNLTGVGAVRALELSWEVPEKGVFDSFRVSLTNIFKTTEESFAVEKQGGSQVYSFSPSGLVGGMFYQVHVFSVTLTEESKTSASSLYFTLPEPVSSLSGQALNTTAVQLYWLNPLHSEYAGLEVSLTRPPTDDPVTTFNLTSDVETHTLLDLDPGVEYVVEMVVMSKGTDNSAPVNTSVRTKPEAPLLEGTEVGEDTLNLTLTGGPSASGVFDSIKATLQPLSNGSELTANSEGVVEFLELTPGTLYTLEAYTTSGQQTSQLLTEILYTKPRPPQNLNVEVQSSEVLSITWEGPDRGGVDNYTVTITAAHGAEVPTLLEVSEGNVTFSEAHPGETYNVTVIANFGTQASTAVTEQNTTYPESVAALQKVNATSNSITVNWTAPVSGRFRMFQLGIKPAHSPNSVLLVNASQLEHTFVGLRPGHNYTVAIRTVVARNNYGVAVRLNAVTKPLPVEGLMVEAAGAEELRVTWAVSNTSDQDRFTIVKEKDGQVKSQQLSAVEGQTQYEVTLDQLLAGHTYSISITAIREIETDIEESEPENQNGTTNPLPVVNLTMTTTSTGEHTVGVTWQGAEGSVQDSFRLRYRPVLRNPASTWLEQTAVAASAQFSPVFPGEQYQVEVIAISNGQESDPTPGAIVIAPLPPTVIVDTALTTTHNLTLRWTHNAADTYVEWWVFSYSGQGQTAQTFQVNVTAGVSDYASVLDSLTPGVTYIVEVMAVSRQVMSETVNLSATAKPRINTNIVEIAAGTSSSQLSFRYTVTVSDVFDALRFSLVEEGGQSPVEKRKDDRAHNVTFTGLQGGRVYTVQAVTVSGGVVSDPVTKRILTEPNNVQVEFQSKADEVVVQFTGLEGSASSFLVRCLTPNTSPCGEHEVQTPPTPSTPSTPASTTVTNLQPYTTYTLIVATVASGQGVAKKTVEVTHLVRTAEAAPSAVQHLRVEEDGLRTVQVSWGQPTTLNGLLRSYRLQYSGSHANGGLDSGDQNLSNTTVSLKLTALKAGYTYTFTVMAITVAQGPPSEKTVTLSTGVPQFKAGFTADNSVPVKSKDSVVTETSLSIQFRNAFSDINGVIEAYTVIVAIDSQADTSSPLLATWGEAWRDGSIKAYQATDNCTDLFLINSLCGKSSTRAKRAATGQDVVSFMLGMQSAEDCKTVKYCNGPLRAETEYYVKLRAFTQSGFNDTAFSSKIKTANAPQNATIIIAAVVSVVVVLVIVIIIVIIVVRLKRRPKRATKYQGTTNNTRSTWESNSLKNFSRPVKVRDFPEHVRKMAADSDFKYAEEYEDLKEVGRDQTCIAAEMAVNRPKNRFTNILPYDHSRVKLLPTDDEEGSDYINANYMPGFTSKREYIATQGPLPATRDDFWRMTWEQNARNIVMLTRCMEKGREKSDHYWPADSEPKYYGDLQVVILNETHLPDWTITEFRMCLGDTCRQVRHFHYKAWPDFGVPKNHSSLIRFVRMVREKLIKEGGPIITHCSAGVGRSGTFIVLDHCLQLVKQRDEVDVFGIVYSLRRERVLMVQTEQQYKFVHECLACVLEGREDDATYANIGQVNVGFEDC